MSNRFIGWRISKGDDKVRLPVRKVGISISIEECSCLNALRGRWAAARKKIASTCQATPDHAEIRCERERLGRLQANRAIKMILQVLAYPRGVNLSQ